MKRFLILTIFCFGFWAQADCPQMTGHYKNTFLGVVSDLRIQNTCDTATVILVAPAIAANLLGVPSHTNFQNLPLDGKFYDEPPSPDAPNEDDLVSAQFMGTVATIYVTRQFDSGTVKKILIQTQLKDTQHLELWKSDIDSTGKPSNTLHFEFTRQSQ